MGNTLLALPDAPETIAVRAVVAILKTDPTLSRLNIQWQTWENDPTDEVDPTVTQLPYIQLTPAPGRSGWAEEAYHYADITITITIATAGTHRDDMLNLWGAVRMALWPAPGTPRRDYVNSLMVPLVFNGELNRQPFAIQMNDSGTKMLVASGALYLKLDVKT